MAHKLMRIALVHFNLAVEGGDSRVVPSVAKALGDLGHRVVVFTPELKREYYPQLWEGIEVQVVPSRVSFSAWVGASSPLGKMKQRLLRNRLSGDTARRIVAAMDGNFDVVYCVDDYSYKTGYFYKKKNPSARFIWIMFDPPFRHRTKRNPLVNFVSWLWATCERVCERKFYSTADYVAVLDETNEAIVRGLGLPVKIIRSGLDFQSFYAPVKDVSHKATFTLLGVGSLSPYRKFEDVIRACAFLRQFGLDVKVTLVCKDLWNKKAYRKELIDLARREGVSAYINFMFQGVSEGELRRIYKASDIFVFPNTERIWGLATLEAMASGLPVVVSSCTTVAEFLSNGQTAVFSNPGDARDISDKIKGFLEDPAYYSRIARQGQQFVKDNLTWQNYAEKLIEVAQSI
ncbi:MAG: glycosyltransferase family 4 protein [Parcubacteria group bacterium]|nr:glycosyltransferase family 4 protein [Parcubacteria group bacterium]